MFKQNMKSLPLPQAVSKEREGNYISVFAYPYEK